MMDLDSEWRRRIEPSPTLQVNEYMVELQWLIQTLPVLLRRGKAPAMRYLAQTLNLTRRLPEEDVINLLIAHGRTLLPLIHSFDGENTEAAQRAAQFIAQLGGEEKVKEEIRKTVALARESLDLPPAQA